MWIKTGNKIIKTSKEGDVIKEIIDDVLFSATSLAVDNDGVVWIVSNGNVYCVKDDNLQRITPEWGDNVYGVPFYFSLMTTVFVDNQNNKWFLSEKNVGYYNGTEWKATRLEHESSILSGYSHFSTDTTGRVWLNTFNGINHFYYFSDSLMNIADSIFPFSNVQRSQQCRIDNFGNIWDYDSTGFRLHTVDSTVYFTDEMFKYKKQVRMLFTDDNIGWFLIDDILYKYDYENWSKVANYPWGDYSNFSIKNMKINKNGWVYVSTSDGLFIYNGDTTKQIVYGIAGATHCIVEDNENNMWFGTSNGLSKYKNGKWELYNRNNGLVSSYVTVVHVDRKGVLWAGTSRGLMAYDGNNWKTFSTKDGLSDSTILAICSDFENNIWVGTNNGISKFDGFEWTTYSIDADTSMIQVPFIEIDRKKNIYAVFSDGTYNKCFAQFIDDKWEIKKYNNSHLGYIHDMAIDQDGNLFICNSSIAWSDILYNSEESDVIYRSRYLDENNSIRRQVEAGYLDEDSALYRLNLIYGRDQMDLRDEQLITDSTNLYVTTSIAVTSDGTKVLQYGKAGFVFHNNFIASAYNSKILGGSYNNPYYNTLYIDSEGTIWSGNRNGAFSVNLGLSGRYDPFRPRVPYTIFNDLNQNGVFDSNEPFLPNQQVEIQNNNSYKYIGASSEPDFEINLDDDEYSFNLIPSDGWDLTTQKELNASIEYGEASEDLYWGLTRNDNEAQADVVFYSIDSIFTTRLWITANSMDEIDSLKIILNPNFTINNSSIDISSIDDNCFVFDFQSQSNDSAVQITIDIVKADSTEINDTAFFSIINPVYNDTVSYNFNNKLNNKPGALHENLGNTKGFLQIGDELEYVVYFHNSNDKYTRISNVIIEDYLSEYLDCSSFHIISSSHDYTYEIKNHLLTIKIKDQYLISAERNPYESVGYVKFRIKGIDGIEHGTEIKNRALITYNFFNSFLTDDEIRIFIDTAYTEPTLSVTDNTITKEQPKKIIYPIPVQERLTIPNEYYGKFYRVFDMNGFLASDGFVDKTIDVSNLPIGCYVLYIDGIATKFQKE